MTDRLALPCVPHEIALTGQKAPSYRALYLAALDGNLPSAERSPTGRWTVARAALPEIAAAFAPPVQAGGPQPIWPGQRDEAAPYGLPLPKGRRRRASAPAAIAA